MAMRTNRALPPPLTSTSTSSRPTDCATRCAISSIFAATIATTSRIVPDLPPPTKKWAFAHRIGSTTQTTVYRVYGNCGRAEYGGGATRGARTRSSGCFRTRAWGERHFGIEKGIVQRTLRRPGLAGVCRAYPAASDLVGIYDDVGAVLITLSTSIVPSFRFATSVSRGSAIGAIRSPPGYYPFERKISPPVSSTKGNHR